MRRFAPTEREWIGMGLITFAGLLLAGTGYTLSHTTTQIGDQVTGYEMVETFVPEYFVIGAGIGFAMIFVMGLLTLRFLTIDDSKISSGSVFGLVKQSIQLSSITSARWKKVPNPYQRGFSFAIEVEVDGEWRLLLTNETFLKEAHEFLPVDKISNQSPQTRSTSGPV